MKSLNVFLLIKNSVRLIKQDYLIFAPFLIFNFLYTVSNIFLTNHFHLSAPPKSIPTNMMMILLGFVACSLIISLFFKLMVIAITDSLDNHTPIPIPVLLKQSLNKFPITCINIFIILLPFLIGLIGLIVQMNTISNLYELIIRKYGETWVWIGFLGIGSLSFIVLAGVSLMIEFIPIILLLNNQKSLQGIPSTSRFLLNNVSNVLLFFLITFIIRLCFWIVLAIVITIPMIGISVLSVFIQAISDTLICVMAVLFYRHRPIKMVV